MTRDNPNATVWNINKTEVDHSMNGFLFSLWKNLFRVKRQKNQNIFPTPYD